MKHTYHHKPKQPAKKPSNCCHTWNKPWKDFSAMPATMRKSGLNTAKTLRNWKLLEPNYVHPKASSPTMPRYPKTLGWITLQHVTRLLMILTLPRPTFQRQHGAQSARSPHP